jgi:hypothetical protein
MAESHRLVPPATPPAPQETEFFGDYSPVVIVASAVILVLAVFTIDRLTGHDRRVAILHLVPIAMITWSLGRRWGLMLVAGVIVLWALMPRAAYGRGFYWDAAVLVLVFIAVTLLLARLREALQAHEVSAAMIEKLDAPAYVVNLQRDLVVFGNQQFRAAFDGRSAEELAARPAREARFHLADGTPAVLRILL